MIGVLGTYNDITEQLSYREKIEQQALLDPLTKLANRRKLQNIITGFKGVYAGLIFIDLDYFKTVNGALGHLVGDELLKLVAKRLQAIIKETGLVGRFGGVSLAFLYP